MPETTMNTLLDSFMSYLRNTKSCSENTVLNYAVDLAQFADFIEARGLSPESVTTSAVRAFLRSLSGFGYAGSSISRKLSAVKAFELYLLEKRVIASDPAAPVRSPRLPERLPRALSREGMARLIDEAWKIEPRQRNGALIEVMYGCGLRVAEAVSLEWENVDLDERWLKVLGKGDKERLIPFGRYARDALAAWRELCPGESRYVFPGKEGAHITIRTAHRLVVKAALNAGLENVSPHSIRHSFATHMLEGGATLNVLQELLGHESLLTTQKYLKVTPGHLRESYMAAHPRSGGDESHDRA